MNALDDGPRRLRVWSWAAPGCPCRGAPPRSPRRRGREASAEAAVSSASPRHLVAPADPDRGAERRGPFRPLDPPHLGDGGPAERRLLGVGLERPREDDPFGGEVREEAPSSARSWNAPHPAPRVSTPRSEIEAARTGVTDGITRRPPTASTTSRSGREDPLAPARQDRGAHDRLRTIPPKQATRARRRAPSTMPASPASIPSRGARANAEAAVGSIHAPPAALRPRPGRGSPRAWRDRSRSRPSGRRPMRMGRSARGTPRSWPRAPRRCRTASPVPSPMPS